MTTLVERLLSYIGQEFDGECHLTEAEAREAAATIIRLTEERDEAWMLNNMLIAALQPDQGEPT